MNTKNENFTGSSINTTEIEKFSVHTNEWWNEHGPYKILHQINPIRLKYIQAQLNQQGMLTPPPVHPLKKSASSKKKSGSSVGPSVEQNEYFRSYQHLSILDVGCGGGIVCEPLARLGAMMTGIDAVVDNINTATTHALEQNLNIAYHCTTVEEWVHQPIRYDVLIAFEIVEHVENPELFLTNCLKLLKPKGLLIISTLNRTLKSYLLSIIAAEYVLQWVPRGTHEWQRFLKPSEVAQILVNAAADIQNIQGLEYNILKNQWFLSLTHTVNYFLTASKN